MKILLKAIFLFTILVTMNNSLAKEVRTVSDASVWFSTTTSALVNRSSTALATNHINRGIRLACQALQNELILSDQLIANHNLCVGFLSRGETAMANPFCMRATEYAQLPFTIINTRGAYFLSEETKHDNTPGIGALFHLVVSNIERQNPDLQLSLGIPRR